MPPPTLALKFRKNKSIEYLNKCNTLNLIWQ